MVVSSMAIVTLFLTSVITCYAGSATFTYDELNRLKRIDYGDGWIIEYTYDRYGNRTQKTVTLIEIPHPGDTNVDWRVVINEVTAYGAAWKCGESWPTPPNPIPIEYVTNCGYLWRVGEVYHYIGGGCPACWVSGTRTLVSGLTGGGIATRILPRFYTPGVPVSVSITVIPDSGTQVYAVEDAPPANWVVSDINESGQWDDVNKKVKWGPFFDNNTRTLTYQATPPSGETGIKTFTGTAAFDSQGTVIAGDQIIYRGN